MGDISLNKMTVLQNTTASFSETHWSISVMLHSGLFSQLCVYVCTGLADTNINQFRRKCHSASLIPLFVLVMRLFCRFIWSAATDLKSLAHPRPVCSIICLFHLFVQYGGQAYWLYDRYNVQVKWFMFVHFVLLIVITAGLWGSVNGNHLPAPWNDWMLEVPNIFWDNNVIVHPARMTLSSISNDVIRLTAFN